MKYIICFIVFGLTLASGGNKNNKTDATQRLAELEIAKDNYPKAIFFRKPESAAFLPYDFWEEDFSQLMGIEGKAIDEEKHISFTWRNAYYFSKFKEKHPGQLVLLHCNGMGRKPEFKPKIGDFFAGHWLYYEGVKIVTDVPAEYGISDIKVSDASQFFLDIGLRAPGFNDEIGLCELKEDGKPNWHKSEQVKLLEVDYENNILKVQRACFGTEPIKLGAGKSYAAAHCLSGPWKDTQLWAYNLSTTCPEDKYGKTCIEVLVDDLAYRFSPQGELFSFDGVEFDSFNWHPQILNPRGESGRGTIGVSRQIDANADGKADNCIIDGVSVYGLGVNLFVEKLREKLGNNRIIMGDGTHHFTQRAFQLLNGIESEGWPNGADPEFEEWSDGINRMQFWNANAVPPVLSYMNFRYWGQIKEEEVGGNNVRLVIAASTLTNSILAQADRVEKFYSKKQVDDIPVYNRLNEYPRMKVFDELVMGKEKKTGWLGEPLGETVCLARQTKAVLNIKDNEDWAKLVKNISGKVKTEIVNGMLMVTSTDTSISNLKFTIHDVPANSKYLTVFLSASGQPMPQYPENVGRLLWIEVPQEDMRLKKHMAWVNQVEFESVFSFGNINGPLFDLIVEVEGIESIFLNELSAYAEGDVRYREFENGIVLANPKSIPHTFNLSELFPGQSFRRIKGSPEQDTFVNNGEEIKSSSIVIPPKDALFLIKQL